MSKMRGGFFIAATAVALVSCQQTARPVAPAIAGPPTTEATDARPQAGRFQLFQGWYRFINPKGEESRTETLFKIDTATGELFECSSVQFVQDGKGTQKTACLPFEGDLSLGPVPAQK